MKHIYDNCYKIIGSKKAIYDYVINNEELETWEYEDLLEEIKDLDNEDIICVDYDNGMGYRIDVWTKKDIIK